MDEVNALLGGVEVEAAKLDGTTEKVKVRDLPLSVLPRYWSIVEDEGSTIELFCDKEAGWAATLTRESWEEIVTIGEERNLDFLLRFSRRMSARREKVMPGLHDKLLAALSRNLSVASQSSPES